MSEIEFVSRQQENGLWTLEARYLARNNRIYMAGSTNLKRNGILKMKKLLKADLEYHDSVLAKEEKP